MSEQEIINAVGTLIVSNWTYFLSGTVTFLTGCIFLSWQIANAFHRKERELLQAELTHQKERFSQFETIVEQRINMLQVEAELLNKKVNPSKDPMFPYGAGTGGGGGELSNTKSNEQAMLKIDSDKEADRLKELINRTEVISSILKTATGFL